MGSVYGCITARTMEEEKHAHIACYFRDTRNGKIYGLTNMHVTIKAKNTVDLEVNEEKKVSLGKPISSGNDRGPDIGLVEINEAFRNKVFNQVTDRFGNVRKITIFEGRKETIYGKKVTKCKSYCQSDESNEVYGRITSFENHKSVYSDTDFACQFCIEHECQNFSGPGDSGTAIALTSDSDAGVVQVVGMVSGGDHLYTYCIYLPEAINNLNKYFGMQLELFMPDVSLSAENNATVQNDQRVLVKSTKKIECSVTIFFRLKTPEEISPYSFDLVDYTITLTGIRYDDFSGESQNYVLDQEKEMKRLINLRETLECYPVFENDNPDYKALEQGLKAVDCMINGEFDNVETMLKVAMKCIPNCLKIGLRLFAKNYNYVMWYLTLMNEKHCWKEQEKLIQEGIEFYEDSKGCIGFPKEVGGYIYYEYSRFFIQSCDALQNHLKNDISELNQKQVLAIEKARKAVQIMEEVHSEAQTPLSLVRQSFIQCELAFALLRCGNEFGVRLEKAVPSVTDINEAEALLANVTESVVKNGLLKQHAVKYDIYLVALCDLYFRKGEFHKAFETAETCLAFAKYKREKWGERRAKVRVVVLENHFFKA